MNKTLNINLGGLIFHIDENAYIKLDRYLSTLKRQFATTDGGAEIIKDIETRISELFKERTSEAKEVISVLDVEEVIGIMGKPEDYLDPDQENSSQESFAHAPESGRKYRRIYRDPDDKVFGGVASGLAAYFNADPIWLRILFVVLAFSGFSILFYIILWVVIPKALTTAEKLKMRGESVNISNIEKSVKEEFGNLGQNVKDFTRKASEYDYSKPAHSAGNALKEVMSFIINAIKLVFSFFFKLIGFGFLAIGFLALFVLIIGLFSGGFQIIEGGYGMSDLYEFLKIVTLNTAHLNLLMIGVFMLILAPLVLIIYLGVRIIFKLDPLGSPARKGLTGIAIVGFVLVLVSGIRIGVEFDTRSYHVTNERIETDNDILYLSINKDGFYDQFRAESFNNHWLQTPNGNAFTHVSLNIKKSENGTMSIKRQVYSQGNTRRAARDYAQKVKYNVDQKDSLINFDMYYEIGEDDKFRGQKIYLTLYIPEGKSVFMNDDLVDIIYDIDNINGFWDFDMVNHTWKMTRRGLKCTDCGSSGQDEWEEEIENEIEELQQMEIQKQKELEELKQEIEELEVVEEEEKEDPDLSLSLETSKARKTVFIGNSINDFIQV